MNVCKKYIYEKDKILPHIFQKMIIFFQLGFFGRNLGDIQLKRTSKGKTIVGNLSAIFLEETI